MSKDILLAKLITNVVKDSKIVGSSKRTSYWLNKLLSDYNGQLLSFSSYNPNIKNVKDLIGNSFKYNVESTPISLNNQICLIPKRDTIYLTFKDNYYLLFKDNKFMKSFVLSNDYNNFSHGPVLTNNDIRSKLKPETNLDPFLKYYISIFNTLQDYYHHNNNERAAHLTDKDISSVDDIFEIHKNQLQPILNNSLLLWNYPTDNTNKILKIEDIFWHYKINNCLPLYKDPNKNSYITLHYLSFENSFERNKFKSNVHGTFLPNSKNKLKLLIETL